MQTDVLVGFVTLRTCYSNQHFSEIQEKSIGLLAWINDSNDESGHIYILNDHTKDIL